MSIASRREQTSPPIAPGEDPDPSDGPGRILFGVFETFDRAGIPYCVLHGYENYPQVKSDVDCVIDARITPSELYALIHDNRAHIGADLVRCRGYHIVLAGKNANGLPCFLTLDLSVDCEIDGLQLYAGAEILASRRRYDRFWIPAANLGFGCYLARSIAKGVLDEGRARRLSALYQQDAARCEQQLARFWGTRSAELIRSAARSGDWRAVQHCVAHLRAELRGRVIRRRPGRFVGNKLRGILARAVRVLRPDGVNLVLLGPDGAGKSSVIEALGPNLVSVFPRSVCWGFAPPLHRLIRRGTGATDQPHALPPRSFLTSVVRAAYWWAYATFGYANLHLALARSTLVLHDRHFVDIFVDVKRYRYGGPLWLVRLIWRVIPKPDIIVILDAPPEVLQARKQEVSFDETARQRSLYLALARSLANGHVVDAAQSPEHVAGAVSDVVLRHLASRLGRRFGLEHKAEAAAYCASASM